MPRTSRRFRLAPSCDVIKRLQKRGPPPGVHGYLAVRVDDVRAARGIHGWCALNVVGCPDRPSGLAVTELRVYLNAHTLAAGD
jgi:hypothetical protein